MFVLITPTPSKHVQNSAVELLLELPVQVQFFSPCETCVVTVVCFAFLFVMLYCCSCEDCLGCVQEQCPSRIVEIMIMEKGKLCVPVCVAVTL